MSAMIRKQVYIEPDLEAHLKRLSIETGITQAELIRQVINQYIRAVRHPQRKLKAWEAEQEYIKQLMDRGAVPGGRAWMRNELYEC